MLRRATLCERVVVPSVVTFCRLQRRQVSDHRGEGFVLVSTCRDPAAWRRGAARSTDWRAIRQKGTGCYARMREHKRGKCFLETTSANMRDRQ